MRKRYDTWPWVTARVIEPQYDDFTQRCQHPGHIVALRDSIYLHYHPNRLQPGLLTPISMHAQTSVQADHLLQHVYVARHNDLVEAILRHRNHSGVLGWLGHELMMPTRVSRLES